MTYSEIYKILLQQNYYGHKKIIKSLSLVVQSSMEPKYKLVRILLQCTPTTKELLFFSDLGTLYNKLTCNNNAYAIVPWQL
jgi:hypothetical protein